MRVEDHGMIIYRDLFSKVLIVLSSPPGTKVGIRGLYCRTKGNVAIKERSCVRQVPKVSEDCLP